MNSERLKVPFSFLPALLLPIQPPLRPYRSLGYHGTKTPVATHTELHKSDFYCVALLLISIHRRLYLIPALWRTFSGQSSLKRMPESVCVCVCACACVCICMQVHRHERKAYRRAILSQAPLHRPLHAVLSVGVSKCPLPCSVTLSWSRNHHHF